MVLGKWFALTATVMTMLFVCFALPSSAEDSDSLVSPALEFLAEQSGMAKAGVTGEDISFLADDFERALNVSRISSLTVTSLPERSDGILYLGDSEVSEGQVISRANISYLKFVFMSEDVTDSAFCFSTNHGVYNIECAMYSLEYENERPVVSSASDLTLAVGTYKNVAVYGRMDAYDPEGDAMVYEIIEYPEEGILLLTDKASGDYKYIPSAGYTGKDSFRYVVVDQYGNYSAAAEVSLEVTQQGNSLVYCDLEDSASHVAAISLTERGIMASAELDGQYYFYPSAEVTRAEFLVMAMKTLGIENPVSGESTVFADDNEIPTEYRGYINTAQKLGYVCGRINDTGELVFAPNDGITRAEAATMIHNMVSLDIPVIKPMFVDLGTVPVWAKDAVYAMTSAGIMSYSGGYVAADSVVTRGQCAEMLYMLGKIDQ